MRPARWLLTIVVSLACVGCYKPNFGDSLRCYAPADGGPNSCPEGFSCDRASGYCRRPDGGNVDRPVGSDADATEGGPPVICLDGGRPVCEASDAGMCDPYCQTGCDGCRKKCSVNSLQSITCNEVPATAGGLKQVMEQCTIFSDKLDAQTDDCAPGLVCLEDGCRRRCYRFCRDDSDCASAGCNRPVGNGLKVCDVPFVDGCVPLGGGLNTGCGGPMRETEACYISSSHPTRTICDCPFMARGEQSPCTRSRDCLPGLVCAYTPVDGPICLRVCRRSLNGTDCPAGLPDGSCRAYPGNPVGTTMHADFGYCF
jgi:hypothetical protein